MEYVDNEIELIYFDSGDNDMAPYEIEPDLDDTDPNEPIEEICESEDEGDLFLTDGEADEDALASAGHGLDESYYGMDSDSGE